MKYSQERKQAVLAKLAPTQAIHAGQALLLVFCTLKSTADNDAISNTSSFRALVAESRNPGLINHSAVSVHSRHRFPLKGQIRS